MSPILDSVPTWEVVRKMWATRGSVLLRTEWAFIKWADSFGLSQEIPHSEGLRRGSMNRNFNGYAFLTQDSIYLSWLRGSSDDRWRNTGLMIHSFCNRRIGSNDAKKIYYSSFIQLLLILSPIFDGICKFLLEEPGKVKTNLWHGKKLLKSRHVGSFPDRGRMAGEKQGQLSGASQDRALAIIYFLDKRGG